MGGVVPVWLPVPPEVIPAVPTLFGEVVLTSSQDPQEVMEASVQRMVTRLAITKVPLRGGLTYNVFLLFTLIKT